MLKHNHRNITAFITLFSSQHIALKKERLALVCARPADGRHWPVVLGDARPEDPDCHDGQEGEERLEEAAVDLAVGAVADVDAGDVLEDLADGEEEGCTDEVHWHTLLVWCHRADMHATYSGASSLQGCE